MALMADRRWYPLAFLKSAKSKGAPVYILKAASDSFFAAIVFKVVALSVFTSLLSVNGPGLTVNNFWQLFVFWEIYAVAAVIGVITGASTGALRYFKSNRGT